MPAPRSRQSLEPSALQGIEEATELLRRVTPGGWLWWLAGSMPFVIGLLQFWITMSRSSKAYAVLPTAALVLMLLYWWMKVAHAFFGDHLMRQLSQEVAPPRLPLRGWLRLIVSQGFIHSTMPWILALAFAAAVPAAWAYAFYHNVSVMALSVFRSGGRTRELIKLAAGQTRYRPWHHHMMLFILALFALTVFLNLWVGTLILSTLAQSITGSTNEFTRNPMLLLSSGVLAGAVSIAWLLVGPLVKAIYALRCFRGKAQRTGADLLVGFKQCRAALAILLACCCCMTGDVRAQSASSPPSPTQLDQSIRDVLKADDYQWRMPREKGGPAAEETAEKGIVADFLRSFSDMISELIKSVMDGLEGLFKAILKDWFKDLFKDSASKGKAASGGGSAGELVMIAIKALLIVLGLALIWIVIRQWRRMPPAVAKAEAAPEINLEADEVLATALPENEWLRLAQEKMESGDYRLAMRALFLATLAHLGERKLISISRTKSNGDYLRELGYRARQQQELQSRFGDSVRSFDRAWYGWHDVTSDLLEQFRENYRHIMGGAAS
jgi:hypothetical protein